MLRIIWPNKWILNIPNTHQRGECRKTCIDKILANNSESVLASGTIENDKHHKPIF